MDSMSKRAGQVIICALVYAGRKGILHHVAIMKIMIFRLSSGVRPDVNHRDNILIVQAVLSESIQQGPLWSIHTE